MLLQGNVVQAGGLPQFTGGSPNVTAAFDRQNGLLISELNARYSGLSIAGKLYVATATITAPVIFSTAAGTGGPLLWNPPGSGVNAQILAMGFGETVSTTVVAALGITGNTGQSAAPTATAAIGSTGNLFIGGKASAITPFSVGTVATAGAYLMALADLTTGALTTGIGGFNWVELAGLVSFGPGSWSSVAASATATTAVDVISLVWVELPV